MCGYLRLVTGQFVLANNAVCVATAVPGLPLSRTSENGVINRNLECFLYLHPFCGYSLLCVFICCRNRLCYWFLYGISLRCMSHWMGFELRRSKEFGKLFINNSFPLFQIICMLPCVWLIVYILLGFLFSGYIWICTL